MIQRARGGAALGVEGLLEIGLGVGGPIPFGRALEDAGLGDGLLRGLEIMVVVGGEAEFAAGLERGGEIADEVGLDKAARPVAALGPRVGKHNVGDGNAGGREEIADGVAGFETQHAEIGEVRARGPFLDFADAAQKPLDGEQVDSGCCCA